MDENVDKNGISHFYEHSVFKGTKNRNAYDLVHEIESRGGYINAYTSREYTCFYSRISREDMDIALESICDMINAPKLSEDDANKEKGVIIEEIKSYDDAPDEYVQDLFAQALWEDKQLAQQVAGSVSSVRKLNYKDLRVHQKIIMNKSGMVVVVVGNISHAKICKDVQRLLPNKKSGRLQERKWSKIRPRNIQRYRDVQQSHVVMGTAIPVENKHSFSLAILNVILGEGMSSRLFQKIREDLGLAYSIYSGIDVHEFSRVFSIYMATDPKSVQKAVDAVKFEIALFLQNGISEEELENAKRNILGGMKMNLDSPSNCMNRLARSIIKYNRVVNLKDVEKGYTRLKVKNIMDTAELLFKDTKWAGAAVIPRGAKKIKF